MLAAVCIDDLQSSDRSPGPCPAFCSLQLSASERPLICPEVKTFTKWKIESKLSRIVQREVRSPCAMAGQSAQMQLK